LDHPGLGANKPLVLMDKLNALKPALVDEIQNVLFLRKMPGVGQGDLRNVAIR
jgi:hypothetical protein